MRMPPRGERFDLAWVSPQLSTAGRSRDVEIRPRALDLFCGAGGASMGLHRAGFEVVGVDACPQPEYPFAFVQADALTFPLDGFAFVWASPPCQAFTAYKRRTDHVRPRRNLIPAVRARLAAAGVPYVIENVVGAPLRVPVMLCGSMFGLDVQRHRLFGYWRTCTARRARSAALSGRRSPAMAASTCGACSRPLRRRWRARSRR
jgi:hypothetical protein